MKKVTATELSRTPGAVVDLALREGMIAVTRHGRLVALLSCERVDAPPDIASQTITANKLLTGLSEILEQTENDKGFYTLTRNGREVAWLLPRRMLKELGLEL